MLTLPRIERAPRIGTLAAQRPAWAYYLRRRRRGGSVPLVAPNEIAGLKLWLDAGVGTFQSWAATPALGAGFIDYSSSSGYTADGYTHIIRVYPYKTVGGSTVYSANYLELQVNDDSSTNLYYVNWDWDPVTGAEGYRLLKYDSGSGYNFDYFYDVSGLSLIDTGPGIWSPGSNVLPHDNSAAMHGDPVSAWNDQSGQNNHASQATLASRATLRTNVINGRSVLRFDSDDGYSTPLNLSHPLTVFVVYAYRSSVANGRRAVQGSSNWLIGPYSLKREFFNGSDFTDGPATMENQFCAQAAWQDGVNSRNWVNGAFVGNVLGAGTSPGFMGLGTTGAFGEGLNGDIAEVIAYGSALNEANRVNVWAYLADKYQLS